jgi:NADPH-dependent 2,4-dienoyl-CoA reductase/sulfur reductase-like enzyme
VQSIDQQRKVATYVARGGGTQTSEIEYDYLVAASGLRRVWPVVPQSLRRKQYLFEAGDHIRAATTARHGVVIVGGGQYFPMFSVSPYCLTILCTHRRRGH